MTLTKYPQLEQGSDEWLAARCGIVTASVVGQLLTPTAKVADNDKSRGLTAQLVAERLTGWVDPTFVSADMQRGHDVEPIARDWYANDRGVEVAELGFMVKEIYPGVRLGFSPDGLVGDDGLIEVKAPRMKGHLQTVLAGEVPAHHMPQIQAGLFVSGRSYCEFISYYGGLSPFVKRVHRDEKWLEVIVAAVEAFETRAAEMVADYEQKTHGLAQTERVIDPMEMVI